MISETVHAAHGAVYDWNAALHFLSHRAVAGVEQVDERIYLRTIRCEESVATMSVTPAARGTGLVVTVDLPRAMTAAVLGRVRQMFDLDADLRTINAHLSRDPWMAPLVSARPALRVFGGWDGFEIAARTIFGQQVSVERARQLNGVLAGRCGSRLAGSGGELAVLFPTPQQVLAADLSAMGMPGARVITLKTMAAAAIGNPTLFEKGTSIEATVAALRKVKGVGDWTAHYIAMRACREPDAFPAGDVGLLRGAADATGRRPTPAELLTRAEPWRPWRAYAAHHLWAADPAFSVRSPPHAVT